MASDLGGKQILMATSLFLSKSCRNWGLRSTFREFRISEPGVAVQRSLGCGDEEREKKVKWKNTQDRLCSLEMEKNNKTKGKFKGRRDILYYPLQE